MSAAQDSVPSPADAPLLTADELLEEIAGRGGRIFRMREYCVFVLTTSEELALWLVTLGGKPFIPAGHQIPNATKPVNAYRRAQDVWEWDIYIHTIPIAGDETVHQAARRYRHGKKVDHD
jgi:hypothetical protein